MPALFLKENIMGQTVKVDVLVAEIGSTTTVVNAFKDIDTDNPVFCYFYSGEFIIEKPPFEIEPINSNIIYYEMPKE